MYRYEWAIPDIHGEYAKLEEILEVIKKNDWNPETDLLVFLGDMVDRGQESSDVIDTVRGLCLQHPDNIKAVLGNHDRWFADLLPLASKEQLSFSDFRRVSTWFHPGNGGGDTYLSYHGAGVEVVNDHLEWVRNLPLFIETDAHFYSHAPVPASVPDYNLVKTDEHTLTWAYHNGMGEDEFAYDFSKHGKMGVCGHIHALREGIWEPRYYHPHYLYLDAGCGCHSNAKLYAANLTTKTLYSETGETIEFPGIASFSP